MSNWSVAEKLSERVGCQKKIANNLIRLLTVEDNTPTFIGTDSNFEVDSVHRMCLFVHLKPVEEFTARDQSFYEF